MALIKCPECHSSVSDTSAECPHCGYDIQKYVVRQRQKVDDAIACAVAKQESELQQRLKDIDSMNIPNAPKLKISWVTMVFLCIGIFYLIFLVALLLGNDSAPGWAWVVLLISLGLGCGFLYSEVSDYSAAKRKHQEIIQDFEGHKAMLKKEATNQTKHYITQLKSRDRFALSLAGIHTDETQPKVDANLPKCPTCGSTDITRQGIAGRAVSSAIIGGLAPESRAQFKCNKCGYMW